MNYNKKISRRIDNVIIKMYLYLTANEILIPKPTKLQQNYDNGFKRALEFVEKDLEPILNELRGNTIKIDGLIIPWNIDVDLAKALLGVSECKQSHQTGDEFTG